METESALVQRIGRARERYLASGGTADLDGTDSVLRPEVVESWRRSLRYGLDPSRVTTVHRPDVRLDSPLTRVADAVVARRDGALDQSRSALVLTDCQGNLIRVWVRDSMLGRWCERHDIVPAFSADETVIGTSSGSCLLSGKPMMVRGPEHFGEVYSGITSAGTPIVHPVNRRIVGSLNLTCRYEDTSPVLLSWVADLAHDISRALHDSATRREHILFDAYLAENTDARHPVVALNEHLIITNVTAARLLESVDQALLWEHSSRVMRQHATGPQRVVLSDGTEISVACREVLDAAETIGAVLNIRTVGERAASRSQAEPATPLGRLAGRGPRWQELCRRVQRAGAGWALITGERGTGKLSVALAMTGGGPVDVIDAAAPEAVRCLRESLSRGSSGMVLVIRHADQFHAGDAAAAAALLRSRRDGPIRVLATAARPVQHAAPSPLLAEFAAVVEVPPLRDRLEDLPVLLEALTASAPGGSGRETRPVRWLTETVQALTRLDWLGNVASLQALVHEVIRDNTTGYVGVKDLPADLMARTSRRKLARLEQAEATVIIDALRQAGGNKHQAAEVLGIARSTLYRKIRALGLDLSATAF